MDEWKRQLHTYKEENIRLKRDLDVIRVGGGGSVVGGAAGGGEIAEDLRRESGSLKVRIELLENELMSQEIELQAANMDIHEESLDHNVSLENSMRYKKIKIYLLIFFLHVANGKVKRIECTILQTLNGTI